TQSGLQKIRNAKTSERDSYLDAKSKKLSDSLNQFWTQETYDFKLKIDNGILSFVVADTTTGNETSVLDGSAGFQWWTAFFLELSDFLAKKSGRSIILLDNPATELHDEGKEDVLKFITNATKSNRLQIIYSTHERALIDPWRTDRIRVVELTRQGTKIENVRSKSRHDLLDTIRRNIGSPARYSLFGAPRTLAFEGVSDTYLVSAVNEYMTQQGIPSINRDSYSINAINGIDKSPEFCKFYKEIGLEFVIIVDSGSETESMKRNLESGDFAKYFIEMNQIIDKDSDTEDLIDPKLYHMAFESAYKHLLSRVPKIDEINSEPNRKRITNYNNWFKSKNLEFNKTIVSQQMFNIMMNQEIRNEEKIAFENSVKNFSNLFDLINKKYS
ncbi:MAG: ATP-dependent nuclease, partial [Nitrososphaeraceae archaeon]